MNFSNIAAIVRTAERVARNGNLVLAKSVATNWDITPQTKELNNLRAALRIFESAVESAGLERKRND